MGTDEGTGMTVWWCGSVRRIGDQVGHNRFSGNVGDEIVVEDLDGCLGTTGDALVQVIRWVEEKK